MSEEIEREVDGLRIRVAAYEREDCVAINSERLDAVQNVLDRFKAMVQATRRDTSKSLRIGRSNVFNAAGIEVRIDAYGTFHPSPDCSEAVSKVLFTRELLNLFARVNCVAVFDPSVVHEALGVRSSTSDD